MKVLEIYNETRTIGRYFDQAGFETYPINYQDVDMRELKAEDVLKAFGHPDIIWVAPDCSTYSVAGIGYHRSKSPDGTLAPKTDYAQYCDEANQNIISLIKQLKPKYYFIENPRGGMRKQKYMQGIPMYTVTYCQYGDIRMKPTDIWTNHPNPKFKPPCHNGDSCHVKAPRSSRNGTQGKRTKSERREIPRKLCEHIIYLCRR